MHTYFHWLAFVRKYKWRFTSGLLAAALLPVVAIIVGYMAIKPNGQYVLADAQTWSAKHQAVDDKGIAIGEVLGAGIDGQGRPFKELRARLDVAAVALQQGAVQKLILSGDNRFKDYDEPTAMKKYLMETYDIPTDKLQVDFAGRSTYESCQRAAQVFGQKRLILFSANSHLPRAIFICRHFGIETYGVGSNLEANNATRREAVARVKALYNVYVRGEQTILGAPIGL